MVINDLQFTQFVFSDDNQMPENAAYGYYIYRTLKCSARIHREVSAVFGKNKMRVRNWARTTAFRRSKRVRHGKPLFFHYVCTKRMRDFYKLHRLFANYYVKKTTEQRYSDLYYTGNVMEDLDEAAFNQYLINNIELEPTDENYQEDYDYVCVNAECMLNSRTPYDNLWIDESTETSELDIVGYPEEINYYSASQEYSASVFIL